MRHTDKNDAVFVLRNIVIIFGNIEIKLLIRYKYMYKVCMENTI